jgi:hypothetical protein
LKPQRTELAQLLGDLHAAGLTISLREGDQFAVSPNTAVSEPLAERIAHFKKDILEGVRKYGDAFLPMFAYESKPEKEEANERIERVELSVIGGRK